MANYMSADSLIYVAGHRGLVGAAVVRELRRQGYNNLLLKTHKELDLLDGAAVRAFFEENKPQYVFQCAAKVGGIMANNTYPAQFFYENMMIQTALIHNSYLSGAKRLLFLGSSCIYPRMCPQPMKEEYLLTGELESTNRPYALAKIGGIEMCWAYNRQYGTKYLAAMPTNLYGPGDNYDLNNSHVLPEYWLTHTQGAAGGGGSTGIQSHKARRWAAVVLAYNHTRRGGLYRYESTGKPP